MQTKHIYPVYKESYDLPDAAKEIFMCFIYIFIFVSCYYIYTRIYNSYVHNYELITISTTNCDQLEPAYRPNRWYRYILDDFFNKFTSNSKTINYKFI